MTSSWPALAACALVAGCAGDGETVGEADQAFWGAYRVTNMRSGSLSASDPRWLLDTVEGWGPQTMLLAVDRHISPQISIQHAPGAQISKDKLTSTLQQAVGWSLSEEVEVTASSSTVVEAGWYERMEAYPTFQTVAWDLVQDGLWGTTKVASGTAYRPMGVLFRVVVVVQGPGKEGVDLRPRQPGSITAIGQPVLSLEALRD